MTINTNSCPFSLGNRIPMMKIKSVRQKMMEKGVYSNYLRAKQVARQNGNVPMIDYDDVSWGQA
jgi:A1 Propeptide